MAINESKLRRILREEARRVLSEVSIYSDKMEDLDRAGELRVQRELDNQGDRPLYTVMDGLNHPPTRKVLASAGIDPIELHDELERIRKHGFFDDGMITIRSNPKNVPLDRATAFDLYTSPNTMDTDPINTRPIPRAFFKSAAIPLESGLSSRDLEKRGYRLR